MVSSSGSYVLMCQSHLEATEKHKGPGSLRQERVWVFVFFPDVPGDCGRDRGLIWTVCLTNLFLTAEAQEGTAWASAESLPEMQRLAPHLRSTESEGAFLPRSSGGSKCTLRVGQPWISACLQARIRFNCVGLAWTSEFLKAPQAI